MRLVQKQMMQVKQKERETKQQERDVWREQRAIRHSLQGLNVGKDLEQPTVLKYVLFMLVDTNKKRYDSERQLSQNLQEKDHLEKDFVKKREKVRSRRHAELGSILECFSSKPSNGRIMRSIHCRRTKTKIVTISSCVTISLVSTEAKRMS